jgi:hypothetical protein
MINIDLANVDSLKSIAFKKHNSAVGMHTMNRIRAFIFQIKFIAYVLAGLVVFPYQAASQKDEGLCVHKILGNYGSFLVTN